MSHCRRRAIYWFTRSPSQTCHAKPKTQINRRRTLPASFRWWDAYRKQLGLKDFPKSQDARHCSRLHERGALPMIDRGGYPSGNRPLQQYLGFTAGRWLWSVRACRQPDCKIVRSGRNGQRDWCMSRVTAIISALVICIIVCLSWAVNHYRDNAITYKAQRDKNARELKLANAAITDMQMRQRGCCCARCKIHEGVSWC